MQNQCFLTFCKPTNRHIILQSFDKPPFFYSNNVKTNYILIINNFCIIVVSVAHFWRYYFCCRFIFVVFIGIGLFLCLILLGPFFTLWTPFGGSDPKSPRKSLPMQPVSKFQSTFAESLNHFCSIEPWLRTTIVTIVNSFSIYLALFIILCVIAERIVNKHIKTRNHVFGCSKQTFYRTFVRVMQHIC